MFFFIQLRLQMAKGLSRLKPGVNKRTHLFLSAILWTGVGLMLIAKGGFRLSYLEVWDRQALIIFLALLAGSFKAYFILDKSAGRVINRILNFKDGTCLGAVYSVKTWILVLCMMGMGVILRNSALPVNLISLLYLTIGWALLLSSRLVWKVWLTGK
ncbi:MAG: hypothetical protein WBB23_12590 [Desulforhopalus sp.]